MREADRRSGKVRRNVEFPDAPESCVAKRWGLRDRRTASETNAATMEQLAIEMTERLDTPAVAAPNTNAQDATPLLPKHDIERIRQELRVILGNGAWFYPVMAVCDMASQLADARRELAAAKARTSDTELLLSELRFRQVRLESARDELQAKIEISERRANALQIGLDSWERRWKERETDIEWRIAEQGAAGISKEWIEHHWFAEQENKQLKQRADELQRRVDACEADARRLRKELEQCQQSR